MELDEPPASPRRRPSRRLVIGGIGAAALLVAGAGVAVAIEQASAPARQGKLVRELLATKDFSVAHRGGERDWPEMSLFGYQQSVVHGANALEISLARSSDGVWFGLHDETLDRTSGTSGFIAADHTWAEIDSHKITTHGTVDHTQPRRPYLRFETLVKEFGATHTIFVDPKSAAHQYYPELYDLMGTLVEKPTKTFIAKGYFQSRRWATEARDRGYQRWGYYYAADLANNPQALSDTQGVYSILGLDYDAAEADWGTMLSYGKPVIGHVIPTKGAAEKALARGARGLMISGVTQVLG